MRIPEFYAGKPVLSLQTMLRHISAVDPRVLPVVPDGQYGSNTFASVLSFQEAYGLPRTGDADLETWNTVVAVFDRALPQLTAPATTPIWSANQSVQPGQFNYHLYLVQAMLTVLANFFPDLKAPTINGKLDAETQVGLAWVQSASNLPQTGILDTATWNYLNNLYRVVTHDGRK